MTTKLSGAQLVALAHATENPYGRVCATRPTWKALVKHGYAIYGGGAWHDYTITPAGIEAVGCDVNETLVKQAKARLAIAEESEARVRRNFHGMYRQSDLDQAVKRVHKAQFELAAIECAVQP